MSVHGTTPLHIPNDNRQRSHQLARTKDGHDRSSILTTTPEMSIKTRRGAGSGPLDTSKSPLQTAQTPLMSRDTQDTTRSLIRSRILSASSHLRRSPASHLYCDHRTTVPVENSPGSPLLSGTPGRGQRSTTPIRCCVALLRIDFHRRRR